MEPNQVKGPGPDDMFHPSQETTETELPSESVFADVGDEQLAHLGELQMPRPIPVEILIEVDGFDYFYKLDRREKSA